MHHNIKDIIIEILKIIEYSEDKEIFAHKFIDAIHQEAVVSIINSLSSQDQAALKQHLSGNITPEMEKTLLLQYIKPDTYLAQLSITTEKIFRNYIETIMSTLNLDRQEKLKSYLVSLSQSLTQQNF